MSLILSDIQDNANAATNAAQIKKELTKSIEHTLKQFVDNPKNQQIVFDFFKTNNAILRADLSLINSVCISAIDAIIEAIFEWAIKETNRLTRNYIFGEGEECCCDIKEDISVGRNIQLGDFCVKFQAVFQTDTTYIHTAHFIVANEAKDCSQYHALIGEDLDNNDVFTNWDSGFNATICDLTEHNAKLELAHNAMKNNLLELKKFISNPHKKQDMARVFGSTIQKIIFNQEC